MPRVFAHHRRRAASAALLALAVGAVAGRATAANIAWQVPTAGTVSDFRPSVGPDGTIVTGNGDAVTAVAPDGTVRWVTPATARQGQVSIGPDGRVYAVAGGSAIIALDPADGSEVWSFDGAGGEIVGGPDVGPDGNVYAVASTQFGGIGMFSLTPAGQLRWSDEGDPAISDLEGNGHHLSFATDRVFVAMVPGVGNPPPFTWAYDLDGEPAYVLASGCEGQPLTDGGARMVTGNGLCQEVRAYDAAGGAALVAAAPPSPSPCSGMANVAVGPDGAMYTAFCYRAFWSVAADGSLRWFDDDFALYFWMDNLGVVPDNSAVIDLGRSVGGPGHARAFDTADGALLWQIDLPPSGGQNVWSVTEPVFDPARGRLYFNATVGIGTGQSALVAIDLDPRDGLPGDANGDGRVDVDDVITIVLAWGPCPSGCAADVDGSGTVDVDDVLMAILNWS